MYDVVAIMDNPIKVRVLQVPENYAKTLDHGYVLEKSSCKII
jgi:hypothetical protein